MTQSQTVTVDQQEILNRANEVEAPMADPPTDVPITPCELTAAKNAAQQLVLSADNMREYLAAGAKERQRLATSLRNAAKAYGEVDEEAATALDNDGEGTVQAESAGAVGGDSSAELTDTPRVATAGEPNFMDLKEAARKLETGDQGASLAHFADGWNTFNLTLQGDVKRFRGLTTGKAMRLPLARLRSINNGNGYPHGQIERCDGQAGSICRAAARVG